MEITGIQRKKFLGMKDRARRKLIQEKKKSTLVPSNMPSDQWTITTRGKLKNKDNAAEKHIHQLLKGLHLNFRAERPIIIDGRQYFIDFLVTSYPDRKRIRLALEVDGGYHFTPEQQAKDEVKNSTLLQCSRVWAVLRIRSSIALTMDAAGLLNAINKSHVGKVTKLY